MHNWNHRLLSKLWFINEKKFSIHASLVIILVLNAVLVFLLQSLSLSHTLRCSSIAELMPWYIVLIVIRAFPFRIAAKLEYFHAIWCCWLRLHHQPFISRVEEPQSCNGTALIVDNNFYYYLFIYLSGCCFFSFVPAD